MKFGGTSVGKPERMQQVLELITKDKESKIVVLSAVSGTTNTLVEISNHLNNRNKEVAKDCIEKLEKSYHDFVQQLLKKSANLEKIIKVINEHFEFLYIILKISYSESLNKDILAQGELLTTKIFSAFLEEKKIEHKLLPALEFMSLDPNDEPNIFEIKEKLNQQLQLYKDCSLFITQGYICRNAKGEVDNLKRGGSDYSASLIAAAINASVCEIWTDIDGMHNNDPRVVNKTVPIEQMSFEEAAELAYFGAKILHPASIWPAQHFNIPVKLLNTMQPNAKGTLITEKAGSVGVKAIAAKDGIIAIKVKSSRMLLAYGFLRKIFEVFEKYKTSIDMITTSEVAVSLTIDNNTYLKDIKRELEQLGTVEIDDAHSIVSIVGNEISQTQDVLQKLFICLNEVPIRMVSYGGSKHNISLLIPSNYKTQTLQLLNRGLFNL